MSEKYDYRKALKRDIKAAIKDELGHSPSPKDLTPETEKRLRKRIQCRCDVTGDADGQYDGPDEPAECVRNNFDLLISVVRKYPHLASEEDVGRWMIGGDVLAIDCTIRCGLFPECFREVMKEIRAEKSSESFRILSGTILFAKALELDVETALRAAAGDSYSFLWTGSGQSMIFWPGESDRKALTGWLNGISGAVKAGSFLVEENGQRYAVLFEDGTWKTYPVSSEPVSDAVPSADENRATEEA